MLLGKGQGARLGAEDEDISRGVRHGWLGGDERRQERRRLGEKARWYADEK